MSLQRAHDESTSEQLTYATVNKSKKKKFKKQTKKEDPKHKAAEKGPSISAYARHEVPSASMQEKKENITKQESNSPHAIKKLYTAVKKPKLCEPKMNHHLHTQLKSCAQLYKSIVQKRVKRKPHQYLHTQWNSY